MTNLIGKTTINPILFYSGKIAGYIIWMILILMLFGINVVSKISCTFCDYLAYTFLIFGLLLTVVSLFNLGSSTRLGLPSDDTELKTNGLYKISRNPMYVGFNLFTISAMIYTMNICIILAGIYCIITYHLIIKSEESFLENRFGLEYKDYRKKVRRYL